MLQLHLLSLIVRLQQRCLHQCLCASRFGMSCGLKAFRHQVHFFVIICMNSKMMIGHEYLHAERNYQLSLCGKCNIPLKGKTNESSAVQTFTLWTNHHSISPPQRRKQQQLGLIIDFYQHQDLFFFWTNQTQIKVGEPSNQHPKICPELAVMRFKFSHFDRNGIIVYCYTSGVSRPSCHSWGQIFSHVFGPLRNILKKIKNKIKKKQKYLKALFQKIQGDSLHFWNWQLTNTSEGHNHKQLFFPK